MTTTRPYADPFLGPPSQHPPAAGLSRSTRPVLTSDAEYNLINQLRQMFIAARNKRRELVEGWYRNYNLVQASKRANSSGKPNPYDSEIYPTLSSLTAWMTDQNTMVDVLPVMDPESPYGEFIASLAVDLSDIIYSTWQIEDYDAAIKIGLWDTFMFNTGIYKSVWDQSLSGGYGNAVIRRVDPWRFYVDPHACGMEDAEYFVEVTQLSPEELERRFPERARYAIDAGGGEVLDDRPSRDNSTANWVANSHTLGKYPGGGTGNYGLAKADGQRRVSSQIILYEYWMRQNRGWDEHGEEENPNHPKFIPDRTVDDGWRCVCMANNVILMDEWADDLWSHASHPYERYVFDDIGEFYGIALVDHLAEPQKHINRLLASAHHNADLAGNPVLLEPQLGGTSRTRITNQPGQRIPLQGLQAMNNRPEWMKPPEMPRFVMDLVSFWISRIENISGLSAIVRGATPTARNAEGVIESIQEAAFIRVRASLRNLEKTLERLMIKTMDLIVDNYTEPRITAIIGPQGEKSSIALRARHFQVPSQFNNTPWKYILQVRAGSHFPTSRQARIAEIMQLYALGAVDDEAVLKAYNFPHYREVLDRKYKKMAEGWFQAPGARQRAGRSS